MLRKFGNILIETDEVSALIGRLLVMKNGKTHGIDVKSANAMREAFTPHPCNNRHELPLSTSTSSLHLTPHTPLQNAATRLQNAPNGKDAR